MAGMLISARATVAVCMMINLHQVEFIAANIFPAPEQGENVWDRKSFWRGLLKRKTPEHRMLRGFQWNSIVRLRLT